LLTILDGTRPAEALVYSPLVGFIGAFVGVFIGLAIGVGGLGPSGGSIAGLVAMLLVVELYVLAVDSSADG
jgi:hypothetical protein